MKSFNRIIAMMLAVLLAACILPMASSEARAANSTAAGDSVTADIVRLGGADRFETADRIADEGWTSAETAFLANAYTYADALAGAPLAYAYDAPILLRPRRNMFRGT